MVDTGHEPRPPRRTPKPVAPEKPLPSDCCESGCDRCVYEVYAEQLEHYEQLLKQWQAAAGDTAFPADTAANEGSRLAGDATDPMK